MTSHSSAFSPTLKLAMDLIKCPSLTPFDAGCQALIAHRLALEKFNIQSFTFGTENDRVENLWATHVSKEASPNEPVLCFVGHTDVVPVGDLTQWDSPPFEPTLKKDYLYGRGAADMKGALASIIIAAENFVKSYPNHKGTLAILITSDEEGAAQYGIKAVVEHFKKINQAITWAVIGEPSSEFTLGDTLKNGRRGSLSGHLIVHGKQGHIAYPHLAKNPISLALPALCELAEHTWDKGTEFFPPTQFQMSNIKAGTGANNVIPSCLEVFFNFRFSPQLNQYDIQKTVETLLNKHSLDYTIHWSFSGLPFFTDHKATLIQTTLDILNEEGCSPKLSTAGGTSDGRFICELGSEIVELGPVNATIHQVNEHVKVDDLNKLTVIYQKIMERLLR